MLTTLTACAIIAAAYAGCPNPPTNDTVVLKDYAGTWYEIADNHQFRQEHEKGLVCTRAVYTINDDGSIKVNNTGYKRDSSGALSPSTAIGKAKQVDGGKLAVSFFANFYGPYWIVDLHGHAEDGYSVALIFSCTDFKIAKEIDLWVLSRTPQLPDNLPIEYFVKKAQSLGIDWDQLDMQLTAQDCGF
eukprot:TRINITY_DN12057_c6_g5_i1.p3 TRINITY_DN12057_c6_g5~~TRINITY_DN12057_c6_g5_i1.p3  ORF type:complete len:188 (+),score=54.23 TRINITY_DN12057_c6_g5_i1:60-623(+)